MPHFRVIPSIDQLLHKDAVRAAADRHGRDEVIDAARRAADELRELFSKNDADAPGTPGDALDWLTTRTLALAAARTQVSLRRVINATGVILHTNLGRAPLAASALMHASLAEGYTNLEYDLERGDRGHRHVHAERLLCALTGAEAALVVNNTAAAALLALAALSPGREVIVSRGELVEIGGGFRVPDVLSQSGAILREVGTTNRTRVSDYAAAIGDRTGLILRVHPSNFRIEGFTERPALRALVELAHQFNLPLVEDLGSGWLGLDQADGAPTSVAGEPSVRASLAAGVDLVLFSGDKLLGGPQAGIVLGARSRIDGLRVHPLMRAVRVDKLTYAVLEATLALWADSPRRSDLPVYRMLTMPLDEIERRARRLITLIKSGVGATCTVIDGMSAIGGGSAPGSALPTRLVTVTVEGHSANEVEAALRAGDPPVVARIQDDVVVIDVRTVADDEIDLLGKAINGVNYFLSFKVTTNDPTRSEP